MTKFKTTAQVLVANAIFMIFMYVFWMNGWVNMAIAGDPTMIVITIMLMTLFGIGVSLYNAVRIDREISSLDDLNEYSKENLKEVLSTR